MQTRAAEQRFAVGSDDRGRSAVANSGLLRFLLARINRSLRTPCLGVASLGIPVGTCRPAAKSGSNLAFVCASRRRLPPPPEDAWARLPPRGGCLAGRLGIVVAGPSPAAAAALVVARLIAASMVVSAWSVSVMV
ncbi:hypothetical protein Dimus_033608 [Dionaea muscipula]